jgi:hypothetical protein
MEDNLNQQPEEYYEETKQEDVVLNLTLTGARECILDLLEQMDAVKGFSVLDGSFIVNSGGAQIT